jgi:hypothetical protein
MSADVSFSLMTPLEATNALEDMAQRQGCTPDELCAKEVEKLQADQDYREHVRTKANEIWSRLLQRQRIDNLWPAEPLECHMVAFVLSALMEARIDQKISELTREQMEFYESEVKRTGRSLTALLNDVLFGVAQ